MRRYETLVLLPANLSEEDRSAHLARMRATIEGAGGAVAAFNVWGERKLAYPVRKETHGNYVDISYIGEAGLVAEFERNLRLWDPVRKFLTTVEEDTTDLSVETLTSKGPEMKQDPPPPMEERPEGGFRRGGRPGGGPRGRDGGREGGRDGARDGGREAGSSRPEASAGASEGAQKPVTAAEPETTT